LADAARRLPEMARILIEPGLGRRDDAGQPEVLSLEIGLRIAGAKSRHPSLERRSRGMRATHEHCSKTAIMGGPNKSGHDG
jgi:hypothetical protein